MNSDLLSSLCFSSILPENMTPAKATSCANKAGNSTSTTSRYSILSDPRLSQLFALSSQLEALAQSIEVQPPSQPQQPPDLPPKPSSLINNNNSLQSSIKSNSSKDSSTHQPPPPIPVKLNHSARGILAENQDLEKSSEVKYTRLQENPEDEENNDVPEEHGKHVILELHSVEIRLFCHIDFT